jgi:hypothetical protein
MIVDDETKLENKKIKVKLKNIFFYSKVLIHISVAEWFRCTRYFTK